MSKLKVFILGFDDSHFLRYPKQEHLVPVNLNNLALIGNIPNESQHLSEGRVFLSKTVDRYIYGPDSPDFVGFATWRWWDKFKMKKPLTEWGNGDWQKDTVYVVSRVNWYEHSCYHHPGIQKYLLEMSEISGLKYWMTNGFYFNNFVCTKEVYSDFQVFFRKVFFHFHAKYGYNYDFQIRPHESYNHRVQSGAYIERMPASLYERIAALYFSNRTDLKMVDLV